MRTLLFLLLTFNLCAQQVHITLFHNETAKCGINPPAVWTDCTLQSSVPIMVECSEVTQYSLGTDKDYAFTVNTLQPNIVIIYNGKRYEVNKISMTCKNITHGVGDGERDECSSSENVCEGILILESRNDSFGTVSSYYIPNAFSPNGDGNNDTFYIHAADNSKPEFEVYDRWGELLFKGNEWYGGNTLYQDVLVVKFKGRYYPLQRL